MFASIFIIVLILSLITMLKSPFFFRDNSEYLEEKTYHYAFFLPASDSAFFKKLKEGALSASLSLNCSISFHELDKDPLSLEMVHYTGVDGIGVYALQENSDTLGYFSATSDAGIPVIQIENEIVRDEKTFFIGTNNFESGKAIGKLALRSKKEKINLALVYSEKNPGLMTEANLLELGLRSTLGYHIATIQKEQTTLNPLDAEGLTYRLLRQDSPIDVIVLTDPNDTLVTVQAIVDMNLVGEIQVIGFGDDEKIKEYINKGLVLGTIVRDPYLIGYSAVLALQDISINGYTSAYVDTGISIITGNGEGSSSGD